jgi:hypothetical protein
VKLPIDDQRDRRSASTSASPEEAAAIVAAIDRFLEDTSPGPAPVDGQTQDPWTRAAMLEGVSREDHADAPHPWIAQP